MITEPCNGEGAEVKHPTVDLVPEPEVKEETDISIVLTTVSTEAAEVPSEVSEPLGICEYEVRQAIQLPCPKETTDIQATQNEAKPKGSATVRVKMRIVDTD